MFEELKMKKYAIYLLSQFNLLDAYRIEEGKCVYIALNRFINNPGSDHIEPMIRLSTLMNDIVTLGSKKKPGYRILSFEEYTTSSNRNLKIESIL